MVRIVTSTDNGDVIGSNPIFSSREKNSSKVEHVFSLFLLYPLFIDLWQTSNAADC